MKILRRSADHGWKEFGITRSIFYEKRRHEVGDTIEMKSDDPIATDFFKTGRIIPLDVPAIGQYISIRSLSLPGNEASFTCGPLEIVELLKEQALTLMAAGAVIPRDDNQWRPSNRKLKKLNAHTFLRWSGIP